MASIISSGTTSGTALNMTADTSGQLQLATNSGTTAVTIDTSQNVGIGTASPSAKLHVVASNNGILTNGAAGTATSIYIAGNGNTAGSTSFDLYQDSASNAVVYQRANNPLIFGTNNTERMRIDSSGKLLIGATSAPLVTATTGTGLALSPAGVGIISNMISGNEAFAVNYTSYTNGTTVYPIVFRTNGTTIGYITLTNTAVAYVTSSDYRLKENIVPMKGALDKVALLKPCTYTWKQDGSSGQGFIAHELQDIVPDCVTGKKDAVDANGNPIYQGVDTSFLVATLTAAIQELKEIVDAQAERIKTLEAK
jgi:hypothetical protein